MISIRKRTKKEKAIELYEKTRHLNHGVVVRTFISELKLPSENSARTYISLAKKALASKLLIPYRQRKSDPRKTKRGQAIELFNKNQHLTRKEMMDLFVNKLGMTQASAATHCSMCIQEYVGPTHKTIT